LVSDKPGTVQCELKHRRWIGSEFGPIEQIIDRLENVEDERPLLKKYRSEVNCLFDDKVKAERKKEHTGCLKIL